MYVEIRLLVVAMATILLGMNTQLIFAASNVCVESVKKDDVSLKVSQVKADIAEGYSERASQLIGEVVSSLGCVDEPLEANVLGTLFYYRGLLAWMGVGAPQGQGADLSFRYWRDAWAVFPALQWDHSLLEAREAPEAHRHFLDAEHHVRIRTPLARLTIEKAGRDGSVYIDGHRYVVSGEGSVVELPSATHLFQYTDKKGQWVNEMVHLESNTLTVWRPKRPQKSRSKGAEEGHQYSLELHAAAESLRVYGGQGGANFQGMASNQGLKISAIGGSGLLSYGVEFSAYPVQTNRIHLNNEPLASQNPRGPASKACVRVSQVMPLGAVSSAVDIGVKGGLLYAPYVFLDTKTVGPDRDGWWSYYGPMGAGFLEYSYHRGGLSLILSLEAGISFLSPIQAESSRIPNASEVLHSAISLGASYHY